MGINTDTVYLILSFADVICRCIDIHKKMHLLLFTGYLSKSKFLP